MWIIELNVAGYHYSREIPDLRRRPFRFNPRNVNWQIAAALQRRVTSPCPDAAPRPRHPSAATPAKKC